MPVVFTKNYKVRILSIVQNVNFIYTRRCQAGLPRTSRFAAELSQGDIAIPVAPTILT
jgi:hypothetical protein